MKGLLGLLTITLIALSCTQNAREQANQETSLVRVGLTTQDSINNLRIIFEDNLKGDRLAFGSTAIGSGPCESTSRAMEWLSIRNTLEENPSWADSLGTSRDDIQIALQQNLIRATPGYFSIEPSIPDTTELLTRMCGEVALEQLDKFALLTSEADVDLSGVGFTQDNIRKVAGKILAHDLKANGGKLKQCWPCDLGLDHLVRRFDLRPEDIGISAVEFASLVR